MSRRIRAVHFSGPTTTHGKCGILLGFGSSVTDYHAHVTCGRCLRLEVCIAHGIRVRFGCLCQQCIEQEVHIVAEIQK